MFKKIWYSGVDPGPMRDRLERAQGVMSDKRDKRKIRKEQSLTTATHMRPV